MEENMKKKLVSAMLRGKLGEVFKEYKTYREARQLKIESTGDTMLHLAISSQRFGYVDSFIKAAESETLAIGNEQGDTALHLLAKLGHANFCRLIAEKDTRLVGIRNEFGETPLLCAVSSGYIEAFLCLHHICKDRESLEYGSYVKNNGDTILHSAIFEEHFDIAYIIISEYPELVHKVNQQRLTPLHLLSMKPSVFPSGVTLFGIPRLVYHCVRVQKLENIPGLANAPDTLSCRSFFRRWKRASCITFAEEARSIFLDMLDIERANKSGLWSEEDKDILPLVKVVVGTLVLLVVVVCLPFFCAFCILWIPYTVAKFTFGHGVYVRVKNIKRKCIWAVEVMNKLIPNDNFKYDNLEQEGELPIFISAKHGISEIVLGILGVNPKAVLDVNAEKKNVVMLAVEHRRTRLYQDLITNWKFKRTLFGQVDALGNSLLHSAANLQLGHQFWRIQGAALHMQMEIKWYKFIKKSMPPHFFARYNGEHKTAKEIFNQSHQHLIDEGRKSLTDTSQSCSLVAALIATVAFATSATIPGGLKQDNGVPSLEHKPFFIVTASTSLIALSSSMISVVMFLGILTSNFKLKDFRKDLPNKLLLGLISLLISTISMFISFYAGHYFVLKQEFHHYATLVYLLLCVPLLVFIISKFPLSIETVWTTLRTNPRN